MHAVRQYCMLGAEVQMYGMGLTTLQIDIKLQLDSLVSYAALAP